MAIEKLIPQYLNQDEDERLVKPYELIDALNVRVSNEDDGDQGILKNVEGTTAVPARSTADAIPSSGTNRVIGAVPSDASKCVYFFLYNSNGNHGIYRYNVSSDSYQKLYEDSVLNFEYNGFVKADIVINQYQEDLLYFTDNRNEPRKINATRAGLNQYDEEFTDNASTDYVKNLYLTACKRPPQEPITFSFVNDNSLSVNNLKESCFQFACQYVYDDGEVSSIGVYSRLAVSPTHLAYNTTTQTFFQNENNALDLTIPNSDGPVEKVRVLARKNNGGAFYQIAELDNTNAETQVFRWANDGVYPLVADTEANKPYDSLPRRAGAQAITNNRLLYGNYIDGFNPVVPDSSQYPVYHEGGTETLSSLSGRAVVLDYDEDDTFFYETFGDRRSIFNSIYTDDFTDGSAGTNEISPAYNNSSGINSSILEIDLSGVQETGEASSFAYYFDFSIGEIGWKAVETGSDFDFDNYTQVPITFRNESGQVVTTSSYSSGVRLGFPSTSGSLAGMTDNEKANANAGFRNLRAENNLVFSGTVDVDAWSSKSQLAQSLIDGIVGQTSTVAVSPNAQPELNDGLANGNIFKGNTTEARIENANGSLPDLYVNTADQTNSYGIASKLFLWMKGSVTIAIDSGTVSSNGDFLYFRLSRTGFDLTCDKAVAVYRGTSAYGRVRPHVLISEMEEYAESGTYALDFDNAQDGNYTVVLWDSTRLQLKYSSADTYNSGTYVSGADVNGVDGQVNGGYISTAVRGLTVDVRMSQEVLLENASSFKAGARHDFGIVYYDSRNRPTPVYKLGSINTARFGNRTGGRNGRTEVDIKLLHEPPEYASYWAPVYTKNTTYESFLQVVVAEAALPRKTSFNNVLSGTDGGGKQRVIAGLKTSLDETIFLSMRPLEGKNNSYKELKGAAIDYKYQEGDKLRVIQYSEGEEFSRPYYEFVITGYKYYTDNDENPILLSRDSAGADQDERDEKDAYRRTGWFLSVRDDKVAGFSSRDIALGADYFSQRCLVEIVRPKKNTDTPLYYEVGQQRPIVTTATGRTHGGDRDNQNSASFGLTPLSTSQFFSTQRLYVGDRVEGTGISAQNYVIVSEVLPQDNGYVYTVDDSVPLTLAQNPVSIVSSVSETEGASNSVWPGVITLSDGDVYLRVREQLSQPESTYEADGQSFLYDATDPENQEYANYLIESESVSDFFDSEATSIGRPHIEDTEQVELTRSSSVTYSEPFVLDSSRLSLSSFNPLFFPYKDFPTKYGQVTYITDGGEAAYIMQEKRVGIQPISRTLIESSNDGQLVTSTNVMGTESYFAGMFGPGRNPESVVSRFGKTYFSDVESGKVVELSRNGLIPISDNKLSSYFKTTFSSAIDTETSPRIPSGIDPDNDEYVLTIFQLLTNNLVINDGEADEEVVGTVPAVSTGLTFADGKLTPVFQETGITTWGRDQSRWEDATLNNINWGDKGLGTIVLDRLNERDGVYVSPALRTSEGNITVDIVSSDLRFIGLATLSLSDQSIDLPSTIVQVGATVNDDVDETLVVETNTASVANTLAYSTTKEVWLTRYSFTPEMYANIHNRFLSFYNGQIYNHNTYGVRNNFYGDQYNSTATIVSKADPSMVKVFNAISLEGNDTWSAAINNTEQSTNVTEAMYEEREGMYYSVIPKDTTANSTNNTSHKVVLGEVESVSSGLNRITFTSRISNLPFSLGDTLYLLAADTETTQGVSINKVIDRKTIQVNGSYTSGVGVTLMAVSNNAINGDKMRDYYAEIQLTNNSTAPVELFAINVNYTSSPLHNDQSQKQ